MGPPRPRARPGRFSGKALRGQEGRDCRGGSEAEARYDVSPDQEGSVRFCRRPHFVLGLRNVRSALFARLLEGSKDFGEAAATQGRVKAYQEGWAGRVLIQFLKSNRDDGRKALSQ